MKRTVLYRKSSGTIIRILSSDNVPDASGEIGFLQVPAGITFSANEKIDSLKSRIAFEPLGSEVRYRRSEKIEWKEV